MCKLPCTMKLIPVKIELKPRMNAPMTAVMTIVSLCVLYGV